MRKRGDGDEPTGVLREQYNCKRIDKKKQRKKIVDFRKIKLTILKILY